jgi:hypothetical protein
MNKKLTIIKVLPNGEQFHPTVADLEHWKNLFLEKKMTIDEAVATGEVKVETVPLPEESDQDHSLWLVKIGTENYQPSTEDLDNWREVFKTAQYDSDFKIFTHPAVEVNIIKIGDIVAVE